jgi:hypothetical protein
MTRGVNKATVVRGEHGEECVTEVVVSPLFVDHQGNIHVEADTVLRFMITGGEPVKVTLSRAEELELIKALANRMLMRVRPPSPLPPKPPVGMA